MKERSRVAGNVVTALVTLVAIFTIFYVGVVCASLNLTSEVGETWIRWDWDENTTVDVYIDGVETEEALPSSLYLLSDLEPSEEHDIALYNSSGGELIDSNTTTTLPSLVLVISLLVVSIVFAVLTLLLSDVYRVMLCAGVAFVTAAYCTTLAISHFFGLAVLAILVVVFSVTIVVITILDFWERGDEDD